MYSRRYRLSAITLLFSLVIASTAQGAGIFHFCWRMLHPPDVPALTRSLTSIGYSPSVTRRLIENYPDMAERIRDMIDAGQGAQAAPVTVYRGIKATWAEYRPRYLVDDAPRKDIYFGHNVEIALRWAHQPGKNGTIVMEAQIPRFLIHERYREVIDMTVPVVHTADVPDVSPFITRIGTLDITQFDEYPRGMDRLPRMLPRVTWQNYDDMPRR